MKMDISRNESTRSSRIIGHLQAESNGKMTRFGQVLVMLGVLIAISSCEFQQTPSAGVTSGGTSGIAGTSGTILGYNSLRTQIFEPQCIACHGSSGGINLETYAAAAAAASQIEATVVSQQTMPPMGPLSASEQGLIQAWVNAGAPEQDINLGAPLPSPIPTPLTSASPGAGVSLGGCPIGYVPSTTTGTGLTAGTSTVGQQKAKFGHFRHEGEMNRGSTEPADPDTTAGTGTNPLCVPSSPAQTNPSPTPVVTATPSPVVTVAPSDPVAGASSVPVPLPMPVVTPQPWVTPSTAPTVTPIPSSSPLPIPGQTIGPIENPIQQGPVPTTKPTPTPTATVTPIVVNTPTPAPTVAPSPVTYGQVNAQVLTPQCVSCHGNAGGVTQVPMPASSKIWRGCKSRRWFKRLCHRGECFPRPIRHSCRPGSALERPSKERVFGLDYDLRAEAQFRPGS